jgi:hypothetical protein
LVAGELDLELPPTHPEPEIAQEGEILAVTAPVQGAGDLVVIALEATTAEARDFEVNGPLWDSHVVATEPESAEEPNRRRRLMQQAGRKARRNEKDQALILALQNEEDAEHRRSEATAAELARFHQGALEMRRMHAIVHRSRRVHHLNNQELRIRELKATYIRQEKTIEDLCDTTVRTVYSYALYVL